MKKLLIPLFGALLCVSACNLEDVYEVNNQRAIVVYKDGFLIDDSGFAYTITGSEMKNDDWRVNGKRYYAVFDIKNRMLEITVKSLNEMIIRQAEVVEDKEYVYASEPVVAVLGSASGQFANFILGTYKAKKSDYEHRMTFTSQRSEKTLDLYVCYDGNGENPLEMDMDDLELVNWFFSVPITSEDFTPGTLKVHMNELMTSGNSMTAKEQTYSITLNNK